jgi:hypothetical protein
MKIGAYIDGFNLDFGCTERTPQKWLDLAAICRASFPPPSNRLNCIRYLTAHVRPHRSDPPASRDPSGELRGHRPLAPEVVSG